MLGRRQLIGNSFALLINRLTQSVTTFVLVASIARILGAYQLGQYMLAFSYYFVFMTLASQGFKTLFTRELARNPPETPVYLVSGTLLQLLFSSIGYLLLVILVFALPYSADTSIVCYILGLTIIPFSLSNITEAIFQAQEKMYLIAISTVPVYILRLLVMIWVMKLNYSISFISAIMVISEGLILLLQWGLIARFVKPQWQINWDFMWRTLKSVRTFLVIEGAAVIKGRMQILILSLLGGEIVVGLYGAVTQLMQPFQIISHSLTIAIFPKMSKAVTLDRQTQRHLVARVIEMLLSVALPIIIGLLFIGNNLLSFIYRDPSFIQATVALHIVALGLIASSFTLPLGYLLVANGFERVNMFEVIGTTVVGGLLSVVMVSQYQLNGAAIASLLMEAIGCTVYIYAVYSRLFSLQLWHTFRRPLLISGLMVMVFLFLQSVSHNIILTMVAASLSYSLIICAIAVYVLGGPSVVWAKLSRQERQ